jgi:hypothetical protein
MDMHITARKGATFVPTLAASRAATSSKICVGQPKL